MKKTMWNVRTPFFRPLWRRALACVVCLFWAGVEFMYGTEIFGAVFLVAGGYLLHQFFIAFDPNDYTPPPPPDV
jgi:hypothetical protein